MRHNQLLRRQHDGYVLNAAQIPNELRVADKIRVRELGCLLVDRQCNNGGNPSIECGPRGGNHVFPRRASRYVAATTYSRAARPDLAFTLPMVRSSRRMMP